jgi:two-component sensor histidine kinase
MSASPLDQLDADQLRRRLEEAEDTLRAIRQGEIDALVVGETELKEVFTLEGGTESYRAFMEAMDLGAAALDGAKRLLYANNALCELLQRSSESLCQDGLFAAFDPEIAKVVYNLVESALHGKQTAEIKLWQPNGDRHLLVSASPFRLGLTLGIAVTFADLTERVRTAVIEESERIARAVIASANEAVVVCDRAGIITHINSAVLAICSEVPIGKPLSDAIPLVFSSVTGLLRETDLLAMAAAGTSVQGMEATAPAAPRAKDLLVSAAPLIVAEGHVRGSVVTMVDLSHRKAAERQQLLLMAELDHRVKNTLTLVMSICSRSARKDDTVESFQKAFMGRIQALAGTHTLLAEKSWNNLTIEEVVRVELEPYASVTSGRVDLVGLGVSVAPRAASALGLIFHELTTNAVKYGALSNANGRLAVTISLPDAPPNGSEVPVIIEWLETGGPPVDPPSRRGFGEIIMSRSLSYAPDGGTDVAFAPEGVRCRIRVPQQDVRSRSLSVA